ncbi:O-methyltransferase [Thalictrum thalictroides]|uniref:O-methyltransferase n=1 Tax=Thalictrum thalictroides TaxID=46969 RepID=A0A7J6VL60_THATH|nr:O-methyltransferase [Thalictrum thalictroides]
MAEPEDNVEVQSQADMWELIFAFGDFMVLKCSMKLGIPDIVNKHGSPITISQIAEKISTSPSFQINYLFRIMRFLVRKRVITSEYKDGDTFYSLTHTGKWLLPDAEFTLAPLLELETHEWLLDAWNHLDKCVLEGGDGLQKAHGTGLWDFVSGNPEYNKIFNGAMACTAKIVVNAILSNYNGFNGVRSLIDVGGGTGMMIGEIVKAHPHIAGINFDQTHVLATAPEYPGVVHVPGDMFVQIPQADAVIMKIFEFPMSPPAPPPVRLPIDHQNFDDGFGSNSDSSSETLLA